MNERPVSRERVIDCQHGRQWLIVDLYSIRCPSCCFGIPGGHGRNRLAKINCLSSGERHFVLAKGTAARARKILSGEDRGNPGYRARGLKPIAPDSGVRVDTP